MDGYYLEHQGHVHVGATLSSNMLLNAKKETSLHYVTTDRSSRPEVFLRKLFWNYKANLQGNTYAEVRYQWSFALLWWLLLNRLRIITASLLKEVCHDVRIKPILQKLTGKRFEQKTVNTLNEARTDLAASGFWTAFQITIFDILVF